MFPIIFIGPLSIPSAPLILLLGIWLGLMIAEKLLPLTAQGQMSTRQLNNLALIAILVGLVGARLAYAAQNPSAYANNLGSILSPRPESMNVEAGVLFAMLAVLIYRQKNQIAIWPLLDALTPLLAMMMATIALSHAASGDAFGSPTGLPWGIELWGARRHPVQLYEAAAALAILIGSWLRQQQMYAMGERFLRFMAASAFARVFFEAFRGESQAFTGNIRLAQLAAFVIMALSLYFIHRRATDKTVGDHA